jgi:ATP-dependent Clp protease ATP-binding subunit ClpA
MGIKAGPSLTTSRSGPRSLGCQCRDHTRVGDGAQDERLKESRTAAGSPRPLAIHGLISPIRIEIAKLIGSLPGYIGHRETHPLLSQETLNQFHTEKVKLSFVLFDEIEKASDSLWNLLLGILDKAVLTLGDNRRVDSSRALIFMTSNLGASEMNAIIRPSLGFTAAEVARQALASQQTDKITRAGKEAARKRFSPEFMNRIDKTVVFNPLGEAQLRQILGLEIRAVEERIVIDDACSCIA